MDRSPRRTSTLASLLPAMLLLALVGTAAGSSTAGGGGAAPVVDLTVQHPGR